MLTKLYLTKPELAVFPLREIKDHDGIAFLDCFDRIYRNHKNFVPQYFLNQQVFISSQSFQQSHSQLRIRIRKFIRNLLSKNIIAIGGESYLFGLISCQNIIHYTNSKFIFDDCNFNNKFYRKNIQNNLIDYNKNKISREYDFCLVNLSTLNKNLLEELNNNLYFRLVIISCHHDDFWKKRKFLKNYRLVERKKFVCWKIGYFITVNIFSPNFISLGCNCSVSYNLIKYGLRKVAYPLDWCRIRYKKLLELLKNNFDGFLEIKKFKFSESHGSTYIIENKYGYFAHEVHNLDEIEIFIKKMERRIERFKKLNEVIFVRLEMEDIKDYSELLFELDKKFKNYQLVVISKNKIIGKNIRHFHLPEFINWKYENFNWISITHKATCGVV